MLEVTQLTSSVVVKHTIFIPWERPSKVADTLPPDTLPPNWHQQRRQDAARIIQVTYDSLISHYHWWSRGANVTLTRIEKGICRIGCRCQMTQTPSVPGSPPEPWHRLLSCVCCRWLGEPLYGRVVAHLSCCINKALFYIVLSGSVTVQTTVAQSVW